MKNLLFIAIITLFLKSCAPIVGTVGVVSIGASTKQKGLGRIPDTLKCEIRLRRLVFVFVCLHLHYHLHAR